MAVTGPVICEVCKSRKVETPHTSKPPFQVQHTFQGGHTSQRDRTSAARYVPQAPNASKPQLRSQPYPQPHYQHQRHPSTITKLIQHGGVASSQSLTGKSHGAGADEEGFMDILSTVASALPTGLGLIGGGPIGALAGFALNAASKLTEESAIDGALDAPTLHEGSMERAILAEAALSVLQSKEMHPDLEESIFSDMKDTVMKALPAIRKAAPRVMGAMMEPALKIALDSLHGYNQKVSSGAESFEATSSEPFRPNVLYTSAIDQPTDHQAEAFLSHLHASMQQNLQESAMDGESEEGFFDVITAGVRLASKGVLAAAKHGLPILVDVLHQSGGAESFEDQPSPGAEAHLLAADPLAQRALVADAALTAVMKLPPQQLQEEGFFDFIGGVVKTIAPIAMKVAPVVAGAIHPTIGKIVSGVLKQESGFADEGNGRNGSARPRLGATPGLSSQRSLHSLRDVGATSGERRDRREHEGNHGSQYAPYTRLGRRLDY